LAGGELFDRIVEKGKYSEKDAADTLRTIVRCIDYCHQLSVMHRDLKPENFVLKDRSSDSPICAIDFGLSTFYRENQVFTDLVGSPYYVAPEVLRRRYGNASDIWSCGIILYILLSGVPPFWAQTEQGIFDAILAGNLDLTSDPWPKVSAEAKELISGMLESDPKKRLTTAQVLAHPWVADPSVASSKKLDNVVFKRFKNFAGITKFKKMGLMAMARTMTTEEVAGLKELFKSFDTDNSGTISIDELRQGLKVKHAGPAMEELKAIMKTIDIDGSGELDYEEFIAATLATSKQQSTDAVRRAFDYFDKDGDGSITVEEFEEAFAKMSPVERANLGDIGELIASADTDGDGCIDYKEFMAMMKKS
jgi:calcium-dependent protein kinase